jgi:Fe2+ or Zn2+ uptake regulation protein
MQFPLRYAIHEFLREQKSATDEQLLEGVNKNGNNYSINELNKALMQLEILGLITVRWIGKDKRRVEAVEAPTAEEKSTRVPS